MKNTDKLGPRHTLITRAELAEALGISVSLLEAWARRKYGPRAVKIGQRRIGYRLGDVRAFIDGAGPAANSRRRSQ